MGKKMVLGLLLVGVIGILVAGAIIRTVDKTGNVAEARGQGRGRAGDGAGAYTADEAGVAGYGQGGGYAGEGRTDAPGDGTGTGQAEVDEWLTLTGIVVSADDSAMLVQTDSGEEVVVENRPWLFAQEQGFSAQANDRVSLVGFYEEGEFEVGQMDNLTTGQTVQIRDESGRPLWAGRGRRGS